jgi:hypothetical protein
MARKMLYTPYTTGIVFSAAFGEAGVISKSERSDDEYTETTLYFAGFNLPGHHDRQQRLLYSL